jgi:transcriptional regulator with XRE-family HTH domain
MRAHVQIRLTPLCARCTKAPMHLSAYMAKRRLSDEVVADAIGRSRVSVSRYRRRLVRPDWEAIEKIKAYTDNAVTADDWVGPLETAEAAG